MKGVRVGIVIIELFTRTDISRALELLLDSADSLMHLFIFHDDLPIMRMHSRCPPYSPTHNTIKETPVKCMLFAAWFVHYLSSPSGYCRRAVVKIRQLNKKALLLAAADGWASLAEHYRLQYNSGGGGSRDKAQSRLVWSSTSIILAARIAPHQTAAVPSYVYTETFHFHPTFSPPPPPLLSFSLLSLK